MGSNREQIDDPPGTNKKGRKSFKHYMKRQWSKYRRRQGKQLLDDAPRRPDYKGYTT